jgi:flagellar M-ring protein FliF
MTVSVIIDGDLSEDEKSSIKDIVAASTGYSEERGDLINIAAYPFNTASKDKAQADIQEMKDKQAQAEKLKVYTYAGISAAVLILLFALAMSVRSRRRKKNGLNQVELEPGIDVVIDDAAMPESVVPKAGVAYQPVLSDDDGIDMSLEKELQTYASKKPDQVIEVIKSWLSDDER